MHRVLNTHGVVCGKHRVARLRRQHDLRSKRRRRWLRTRSTYQRDPIAPRLITWPFKAPQGNRVWVTDITFVPTREGWLYLAVVLELCSRRVVGWAMSHKADHALVRDALRMAITRCKPPQGVIHHSDQGSQYTSKAYQALLKQHGLMASMSRKGMPYDNAVVESFFSNLKHELIHHESFHTREEARTKLFDYIEVFYNRQRLHSALGYRSPMEYEKLMRVA
jgi:putative transposase